MAEEKKVVTRTAQEAYNYTMAKIYDLEAKVKALEAWQNTAHTNDVRTDTELKVCAKG